MIQFTKTWVLFSFSFFRGWGGVRFFLNVCYIFPYLLCVSVCVHMWLDLCVEAKNKLLEWELDLQPEASRPTSPPVSPIPVFVKQNMNTCSKNCSLSFFLKLKSLCLPWGWTLSLHSHMDRVTETEYMPLWATARIAESQDRSHCWSLRSSRVTAPPPTCLPTDTFCIRARFNTNETLPYTDRHGTLDS